MIAVFGSDGSMWVGISIRTWPRVTRPVVATPPDVPTSAPPCATSPRRAHPLSPQRDAPAAAATPPRLTRSRRLMPLSLIPSSLLSLSEKPIKNRLHSYPHSTHRCKRLSRPSYADESEGGQRLTLANAPGSALQAR